MCQIRYLKFWAWLVLIKWVTMTYICHDSQSFNRDRLCNIFSIFSLHQSPAPHMMVLVWSPMPADYGWGWWIIQLHEFLILFVFIAPINEGKVEGHHMVIWWFLSVKTVDSQRLLIIQSTIFQLKNYKIN